MGRLGLRNAPVPFFIKPITSMIVGKLETVYLEPTFRTHFGFLEEQLASSPEGGEYLCGKDLTAADILMSFPVEAATIRLGLTKETKPKMFAYVDKLHKRDAYKRAIAKIEEATGEKYQII
jgi:glutathione S-transferase